LSTFVDNWCTESGEAGGVDRRRNTRTRMDQSCNRTLLHRPGIYTVPTESLNSIDYRKAYLLYSLVG